MKKCSWTSLFYLLAILLSLKYGYECFVFWSDLLTVPGALTFGAVSLGLVVRLGIQVICFPKSFFYFRRETELELMTIVSSRWIALLGVVVDVLSNEERNSLEPIEVKVLKEVKTKLELVLKTYSLMSHKQQFTASHKPLHQLFSQLKTVCSETKVNGSPTDSLWDALDRDQGIRDIDSTAIVACANQLRTALTRNVDNSSWKTFIKRWLFNKSMCTLDYLRCELEATCKCEQIWIPGKDGLKIDCMWLQGGEKKAVLLCGGNGFLYECALYMSDSLQSYLQNGFSVMIWNYRGYGRTPGWPAPDNLKKDGLNVAEFIQSVKSVTKLVVHGESMGGMVACFIAARMSIQVLIADRTFSSLEGVAETYGDKARTGMRLLTQWTTDVVSDYISAKCFKVVSSDPHDMVIPESSSLKSEVANRLVRFI